MRVLAQGIYYVLALMSAALATSCFAGDSYNLSHARQACIRTTINEIWYNPKKFTKQRICISGYLGKMVKFGEDSPKIYTTVEEARELRLHRFATLGIPFTTANQERLSQRSLKEVQVEGVLELELPCLSEPTLKSTDSVCSPAPSLRIAKARLRFADGAHFP